MMNIEKLFCGIGMVVDDKIFKPESKDGIISIVYALEEKGFLLAKYEKIPNVNVLNLQRCNFILLDWKLVELQDEQGMPIKIERLQKEAKKALIKFIDDILKNCYLPIFIFSNSSEDSIKKELKENKINIEDGNLPIFIKRKADIIDRYNAKVFDTIQKWIDVMPSIYLLKVWENAMESAKTQTFQTLAGTKSWPYILWNTANEDGVDPIEELTEVLTQNILGRMLPLSLNIDQLQGSCKEQCTPEEILNVLKAQRFESKITDISKTGDMYKLNKKYYLNIRPSCDCVNRGNETNEVYLIKGSGLSKRQVEQAFCEKYGNFKESTDEAIIGPLVNNKFYSFKFKNLCIKDYNEIKNKRVGRILPPFIEHITERYGLYIQRQGLPRIPNEAMSDFNCQK